jgi:hypothetical protein
MLTLVAGKRNGPRTFILGPSLFVEYFWNYWIVSLDPLKPCMACLATHFKTRLVS